MLHFAETNQAPPSLLNVATYCKSSNSKAFAKKLSQILVNNIDNGGKEIGLRIYVKYCSYSLVEICSLYELCSGFSDGLKFENFSLNMVDFGRKTAKQKITLS